MKRALLNINVLLALLDADHVDHGQARSWLESEIEHGWASCAITQNGFVRITSQPRYPSPISPTQAIGRARPARPPPNTTSSGRARSACSTNASWIAPVSTDLTK